MKKDYTCIYCFSNVSRETSELRSREHCPPASFGAFRNNMPLLERLCGPCNNKLGRLLDQLVHTGPIAFARMKCRLGLLTDENVIGSLSQYHHGIPPIHIIDRQTFRHPVLLGIDSETGTAFPLSQVVVKRPNGEHESIYLKESLSTEEARVRIIYERGIEKSKILTAIPHGKDIELAKVMCRDIDLSYRNLKWSPLGGSDGARTVSIFTQENTQTYRAIACIGFHYMLKQFPEICGSEDEFQKLREFIFSGHGHPFDFVSRLHLPLIANCNFGLAPAQWCHVIVAERGAEGIEVHCAFFAGPDPEVPYNDFTVRVGSNPHKIILPNSIGGHKFEYYPNGVRDEEGFCRVH